MVDLETTNLLLGIMAVASALEALLIVGLGVGGYILYRRVTTALDDLERRHVAPLAERVNSILGDVQAVTARVQTQAARVDNAISETMDRVDSTAARVKYTLRDRIDQAAAVLHAFREAVGSLFERRAANY
jgi:uncharacterized protein YoxC